MTQPLRPLWLAMVLLTTLPVGRWIGPEMTARDQGRSVAWYPWVGALIGLVLWLVILLTSTAPVMVQAIGVLVALVALTGGLHLDGLADCIDGAFAGHGDTTRTLAVMREPTAGPMAIIALVLMLLAKFAALVAILTSATLPAALWCAVPLAARGAAAALMTTTAYVRRDGIATDQAAWASRGAIGGSLALAWVGIALTTSLIGALVLAVLTLAVTWLWRRLWQQRIGGYTGDIVGALIEWVEAVLLMTIAWAGPALWA